MNPIEITFHQAVKLGKSSQNFVSIVNNSKMDKPSVELTLHDNHVEIKGLDGIDFHCLVPFSNIRSIKLETENKNENKVEEEKPKPVKRDTIKRPR